MIKVQFFASLSERLGRSGAEVDGADVHNAADVWTAATGTPRPEGSILVAINHEYAKLESPVADGDEVAFFPPVTGG